MPIAPDPHYLLLLFEVTMEGEFTVVEVVKALGFEPTKELDWAAGQEAQRRYERAFGRAPRKDLRPKTDGRGTHCFAVYPREFRSEVEHIVRAIAKALRAEALAQRSLFES